MSCGQPFCQVFWKSYGMVVTSCLNEYGNPMDPRNPDYVPPQITIDTSASTIDKGDTIPGTSVIIAVTGNRERSIFRAKID
jgi:hypothetical protein